jgi:transcriptional regulator, tetR family
LLDGATKLFTTEGIRVIGIDRILREADVAKASLYSLFGSKDALVIAYLKRMDEQWRQAYQERIADLKTPDEKILAFFDQVIEEEPAKQFRGSHFQNAATEFPRPETDAERGIIQAVIDHREWKLATLTDLLTEKNGYPGRSQALQLLVLLDGGLAGGRVSQSIEPLQLARDLAMQLLAAPPADYSI